MKNIIKSTIVIVSVALLVTTSTGAFLSDKETSVGNSFTAGAIDLKVDNESYYNGAVSDAELGVNFPPSDLDDGKLFFNFNDLKPDDEGEDTISLHVNNNDAWLCLDMSLVSNDDISSNEPELLVDDLEDVNDTWDGELADAVNMIWWVDDGDNVLEEGEALLNGGVKTVNEFFGEDKKFTADLADATTNVWTNEPGPIPGGTTKYIAKAWCFGDMVEDRAIQDGEGHLGADVNGPLVRKTGIICDGTQLGNETQTDGITMSIAFRAMQARHNSGYTCEQEERLATITVTKDVVNLFGGNDEVGDFQLYIEEATYPYTQIAVTSGAPTVVPVGDYNVGETGAQGYDASYECEGMPGSAVTLLENENISCTVTNTEIQPSIRLIKVVDGGFAEPTQFGLLLDGDSMTHESQRAVSSNEPHYIDEGGNPDYTFSGPIRCTSLWRTVYLPNLGDGVTLNEGEQMDCYITNVYTPPTLIP